MQATPSNPLTPLKSYCLVDEDDPVEFTVKSAEMNKVVATRFAAELPRRILSTTAWFSMEEQPETNTNAPAFVINKNYWKLVFGEVWHVWVHASQQDPDDTPGPRLPIQYIFGYEKSPNSLFAVVDVPISQMQIKLSDQKFPFSKEKQQLIQQCSKAAYGLVTTITLQSSSSSTEPTYKSLRTPGFKSISLELPKKTSNFAEDQDMGLWVQNTVHSTNLDHPNFDHSGPDPVESPGVWPPSLGAWVKGPQWPQTRQELLHHKGKYQSWVKAAKNRPDPIEVSTSLSCESQVSI